MKIKLLLALALFLPSALFAAMPAAPLFQALNLQGDAFNSKQLEGQPIVISFFFTACVPCNKEMPQLYQLMKQQGLEKNLLFVDPMTAALKFSGELDNKPKVKAFAKKLQIPESQIYFDEFGSLTKAFLRLGIFKKAASIGQPLFFPTIVILDKHHNIVAVLEGEGDAFITEVPKWF